MLRRIALILTILIFLLSGCQSLGTLAFTRSVGSDAYGDGQAASLDAPNAPPGAEMGAEAFVEAFAAMVEGNGRSLVELEDTGEELGFQIDDVSIESEYVEGIGLHVFAPNGETESVTLTMPLPELKDEDGVPIGDEAALRAVRAFNAERSRERAAFLDCVEAAMRAAKKYKNGISEADVLSVLSSAERTIERATEQSEELSLAAARSFVLDVGYTPRIVFMLEFI